jgi:hypothetical protein
MREPKTETSIGWKPRLKLSLAMLVGSVIAWLRPQEIQRVLDDHLAAAERRRRGSPVLTAHELKAVTLAVNLARHGKRGKNAAPADNNGITVDDTRLILSAYFAHLAAQSHRPHSSG